MRTLLPWLVVALTGCPAVTDGQYDEHVRDLDGDGSISDRFGGPDCRDQDPAVTVCDADGDGVRSVAAGGLDCDDSDARVFPEAPERCNGIDDDCDDAIDNLDPSLQGEVSWWVDRDGDGAGDPDEGRICQEYAEPGNPATGIHASSPDDCDDDDPAVGPQADEVCDGLDNNCDGVTDDAGVWLVDADGDGFGRDGTQAIGPCTLGPDDGVAAVGGDCDDQDPAVSPDATEVPYDGIDSNCNGGLDDWDADFDGFVPSEHWVQAQAANALLPIDERWALDQGDCDDTDPRANAGASEVCDGVDNDCDGQVDAEDLTNAGPTSELDLRAEVDVWYLDVDGDGAFGTEVLLCPDQVDSALHSATFDDCYDGGTAPAGFENADPTEVYVGNTESCDGIDNDCNGQVDVALDAFPGSQLLWFDFDGDGFGAQERHGCAVDPQQGLVDQGEDCNDAAANVFPGAPEICGDAVRQDCSNAHIFDCDGDGSQGSYVGGGDGTDCEDELPEVNPDATVELCDGVDNDCDGLLDSADVDDLDAGHEPLWYTDADDDGYGIDDGTALQQCDQPAGRALNAEDCDDNDPGLSPETVWYEDADDDGYGGTTSWTQCTAPVGVTTVLVGGDCDDGDDTRYPGATFSRDEDEDGAGDPGSEAVFCEPPAGESWVPGDGTDCDDDDALRSPLLPELAGDGIDNDCDGVVDGGSSTLWFVDADGDGFGDADDPGTTTWAPGLVPNANDCDDGAGSINPSAQVELCDGLDNNCDGFAIHGDPDVSNPWAGVIVAGDVSTYYLAAYEGTHYSLGLLVASCGAQDTTLDTPDGPVSLLPIDQVHDPSAYLTCPDGVTEGTLWAPDLDGDGAPGIDDPRSVFLACDQSPPASYAQVDGDPDCAPDDPSRSVVVQPGFFGDVDGDHVFAAWTEEGACARAVSHTAGTDCDDHDVGLTSSIAGGTVIVPPGASLDAAVAACDDARIELQGDATLSGAVLASKDPSAILEIAAPERVLLTWNGDSESLPFDLTLRNLIVTGDDSLFEVQAPLTLVGTELLDVRLQIGTHGRLSVDDTLWGTSSGTSAPRLAIDPGGHASITDTTLGSGAATVRVEGELVMERATFDTHNDAIELLDDGWVELHDVTFIETDRPLRLHTVAAGTPRATLTDVTFEASTMLFAPTTVVDAGSLDCDGCTASLPLSIGPVFSARGGQITLSDSHFETGGLVGSTVLEVTGGQLSVDDAWIETIGGLGITNSGGELTVRDSLVKVGSTEAAVRANGAAVFTSIQSTEVHGNAGPAIRLWSGGAQLTDVSIDGGLVGVEIDIGSALVPIDGLTVLDVTETGLELRSSTVHLDGLRWHEAGNSVTAVRASRGANVVLDDAHFLQAPQHALRVVGNATMTVVDSQIQSTGTTIHVEEDEFFLTDTGRSLTVRDSRVLTTGAAQPLVGEQALVDVQRSLLHAPNDANAAPLRLIESTAYLDRVTVVGFAEDPLVSLDDTELFAEQVLFWPAPSGVQTLDCTNATANIGGSIFPSMDAPGCGLSLDGGPNSGPDHFPSWGGLDGNLLADDPAVRAYFGEVALDVVFTPPLQ